jgi:hypothetical protein
MCCPTREGGLKATAPEPSSTPVVEVSPGPCRRTSSWRRARRPTRACAPDPAASAARHVPQVGIKRPSAAVQAQLDRARGSRAGFLDVQEALLNGPSLSGANSTSSVNRDSPAIGLRRSTAVRRAVELDGGTDLGLDDRGAPMTSIASDPARDRLSRRQVVTPARTARRTITRAQGRRPRASCHFDDRAP